MSQTRWDNKYLKLAKYVSEWSKDPSTKVGAVIFDNDNRLVSIGFNGLSQKIADTPERLNNRELKYEMIVHAEMNAILFARHGVKDCILITYPFLPCSRCAAMVIQAGIKKVIAPPIPEHLKERWEKPLALTQQMFNEAGVEVVIKEIE